MTYEQLFMVLSFAFVFIFGSFFGILIASRFGIYLKISKKEDYEEKVKALESMLDSMQQPQDGEDGRTYNPGEMFPPGVSPEYGLPRKLD